MPQFTRGKVTFEHQTVDTIVGTADNVETYSCFPPLAGWRTGHNPVLRFEPFLTQGHLQTAEVSRLEAHAAKAGETLTIAALITQIKTEFQMQALVVNLATVNQAWRRVEKCFDRTISCVVQSKVVRITAIATSPLTVGNVTWPKGDVIAQFQIVVPDRYRFIRSKTRNIKCCPLEDGEKIPEYEPERGPWSAHNFEAISIDLGLDYRWKPDWRLRLRYRYDRDYEFEWRPVEPDDEKPPQPWIIPRYGF
jgi:hypothetical protein